MYKGERFNSYSHFAGAVFAILGFVYLVYCAIRQQDAWKIISFSVYGATLVLLYVISTLYHSHRGAHKGLLRKLDYLSIYVFIAGSYMPFTLVTLRKQGGWWMFSAIWVLALIGIMSEHLQRDGKRLTSLAIYLGMGWLIAFMVLPLIDNLGEEGFQILLLGGIFYTVGVLFYAFDGIIPHFHGIWHLFVLAGSICHYFTVLYYVA